MLICSERNNLQGEKLILTDTVDATGGREKDKIFTEITQY